MPTAAGPVWPEPREAMVHRYAIRQRMAEDIAALMADVRNGIRETVETGDLATLGWRELQLRAHHEAALARAHDLDARALRRENEAAGSVLDAARARARAARARDLANEVA
jgi:hypothetical protein